MKDVKDFDVNEFIPDGSITETIATTASGVGTRPSTRSVSSEQSELTGRNGIAGQTMPTPQSETIEETAPTLPNGEITPIPLSGQTAKLQQTVSTSQNEQSALSHQAASAQSTEQTQSTPTPSSRVSSRQRRASLDEYRETFLPIPKIIDRQPVFVSRDVRDKIDGVVRLLGERRMSVSGFLENLARHHLDMYADDLEQWKRL